MKNEPVLWWPDRDNPGKPSSADKDGWHWVGEFVLKWNAGVQRWESSLADEHIASLVYGGEAASPSEIQALRKGILPEKPPEGLLISMATCLNHGFCAPAAPPFGLSPEMRKDTLSDMRKLYDEVTGRGYFRPERAGRYTDMMKQADTVCKKSEKFSSEY